MNPCPVWGVKMNMLDTAISLNSSIRILIITEDDLHSEILDRRLELHQKLDRL
jgi:hypothetical protein